jgi:inosine-uridine nucleoside N-ribohydrolase
LKVEAITAVAGNFRLELALLNALRMIQIAGRADIRVSAGHGRRSASNQSSSANPEADAAYVPNANAAVGVDAERFFRIFVGPFLASLRGP